MGDEAGSRVDRHLWAEANDGGRSDAAKRRCGPYPCTELVAWLEAHPEADNPLIREYIRRQASCPR